MNRYFRPLGALAAPLLFAACATPNSAGPAPIAPMAVTPTYADLVSLIEDAELVARAGIQDQAVVEPERAPGLAPGNVRLYVEAQTESLLTGPGGLGESLTYLVDLPLDERERAPKLRDSSVLLFAKRVPGSPAALQLVRPDAQLPATPEMESQVRSLITELLSPDAPPEIADVRDVISVPGNLVGESETQMFLATESGDPVSLTIIRRPGMAPQWGVSWSEIVDQAARPPEPDTLEWYRLACFLPQSLPADAFLQADSAARAQARTDYALVLEQLGECERNFSDGTTLAAPQ